MSAPDSNTLVAGGTGAAVGAFLGVGVGAFLCMTPLAPVGAALAAVSASAIGGGAVLGGAYGAYRYSESGMSGRTAAIAIGAGGGAEGGAKVGKNMAPESYQREGYAALEKVAQNGVQGGLMLAKGAQIMQDAQGGYTAGKAYCEGDYDTARAEGAKLAVNHWPEPKFPKDMVGKNHLLIENEQRRHEKVMQDRNDRRYQM